MRELILLEDFKNCLPERTAVYLGEQKITTLLLLLFYYFIITTIFADEFALLHKATFTKCDVSSRLGFQKTEQPEHNLSNSHPNMSPRQKADRVCFFCRKPGHLIAECRAWKREQPSTSPKQPKGVGLIRTSPRPQGLEPERRETAVDCFKPFIFDGFVSLTGKAADQRRVRILRDTVTDPVWHSPRGRPG